MNAIILSRFDADLTIEGLDEVFVTYEPELVHILTTGSHGYSWLTVVPDDVLMAIEEAIYDSDGNRELYCSISAEIYRRNNLKSTKD
jgi:hypothetical protein